jgi:hypothetical protein
VVLLRHRGFLGATIVLIVAPFVLGFSDQTVATVLYVVIGAGGLGVTLLTRFESDLEPARRCDPTLPHLSLSRAPRAEPKRVTMAR